LQPEHQSPENVR